MFNSTKHAKPISPMTMIANSDQDLIAWHRGSTLAIPERTAILQRATGCHRLGIGKTNRPHTRALRRLRGERVMPPPRELLRAVPRRSPEGWALRLFPAVFSLDGTPKHLNPSERSQGLKV